MLISQPFFNVFGDITASHQVLNLKFGALIVGNMDFGIGMVEVMADYIAENLPGAPYKDGRIS